VPTFWVMDLLGFSLNLVSFLAVTLATGILVDDAIVEIENIARHIRMGKTPYRAAIEAADEIGLAVIATTATIIAVFMPVSFMGGIPGQYFRQFGLTVAIAVLFSLLVARLITPMMAAYLMRAKDAVGHDEGHRDGAFMRAYWWAIVLGAVAVVFLVSRSLRSPETKLRWDRRVLGLPVAGDLAAKVETARLARTLGTLLRNGVSLVNALSIARETMDNTWMAAGLAEVARELKTGRGFGKPMMETRRFPAFAVHMIQVGEETGRLDQMLLDVAEVYDKEVARAVKRALALLEPAMILFLTFLVGAVILSILAAMLSIYDLPL